MSAPMRQPANAAQMPVVLMLAALLGVQPVTTDLYLPALPGLVADFGASAHQAQLTLTALLLAFGLSQLVWGPVSDRFGRKPVLLVGLVLYVLAGLGAAWGADMRSLIAWRALQGVGMGAAVMVARAMVRDLYDPAEGAKMLAKGLGGLGLVAVVSAPLGGALAWLLGWRWALFALSVYGGATAVLIAWQYRETLASPRLDALNPKTLMLTWRHIATTPMFWAYCGAASLSYAGLFTFLAASSFVFIQVLHQSPFVYGLLMAAMCLAYLAGTLVCRRLLARFGMQRASFLGGFVSIAGGGMVGLSGWLAWYEGPLGPLAILLPYLVFMVGHGIHQPIGQAGSTAAFPHCAGAASALSGCVMMCMAFGVGAWLGANLNGTVLPLTNGIAFWGACVALNAWTMVQWHGQQRQ